MVYRFMLLLASFASISLSAQQYHLLNNLNNSFGHQFESDSIKGQTPTTGLFNKQNFDFSFDMGYGYSKHFGSSNYIGVNSTFNKKLGKNFLFSAGSRLMFTNLYGSNNDFYTTGDIVKRSNTPNVLLFTKGTYFVSSKLIISGTAFKNFTNEDVKGIFYSPYMEHRAYHGMSIGMKYELLRNVTVGASFNYININNRDGLYDNYYSPFSPYGW